jgi:hypothetical protein
MTAARIVVVETIELAENPAMLAIDMLGKI